ncbi:hypothetical protein [Streptomyces canus]|uniref:hypothetical protein n=1 Tax=Streptomyces canus TaxID=58343 RepID=UPI0036F05BFE
MPRRSDASEPSSAGNPSVLPSTGYTLVTCRLVFAFIKDKPALPNASRGTEIDRDHPAQAEPLTMPWSSVKSEDLDSMCCYVLRPRPGTIQSLTSTRAPSAADQQALRIRQSRNDEVGVTGPQPVGTA